MVALSLVRSLSVSGIVTATRFEADAISVFIRGTLVPLVTPAAMRGRVLATENVFIGASNELGAFESGVAGQLLGVVGGLIAVPLMGTVSLLIRYLIFEPRARQAKPMQRIDGGVLLDGQPVETEAESAD